MTADEPLLSRRALLAAGVLGAAGLATVSGCTGHAEHPVADPDEAAVDAARRAERMLLATYADGTEGHTVHVAHLRALGDRQPLPTPGGLVRGAATAPEAPTVQPLLDAARNAQRGRTAALLASIAASHAVLSGVRVS